MVASAVAGATALVSQLDINNKSWLVSFLPPSHVLVWKIVNIHDQALTKSGSTKFVNCGLSTEMSKQTTVGSKYGQQSAKKP